jgi:hypothetical protein
MTPDEIIKLAREVGYPLVSIGGNPYIPPLLAVLLEAAAEAERAACARLAERLPMQQEIDVRDQCAAAIRARRIE